MAEGQTFKDRDISDAPLDEEDPLMELSRIIGLEPRRETSRAPVEAAPEYHPDPVDIVEEPELTLQPDLSADLQQDLADELIARLEADSELSLDPEPLDEVPVEEPGAYAAEADTESAFEAPVQDYEPATPQMPVSQAASVSLEDELEAILNPQPPRNTPFGLRPVAEEAEPVELRAPEVDSHLDMNFDAEPVEPVSPQAQWAPETPVMAEPVLEWESEVADEHYEAVEPYVEEEAPARSWPPVTTGVEPEYQPAAAEASDSQPVLETISHEPRTIEATDEFEVPEFEYDNAEVPPAADDPLANYNNEYETAEYAKPVVAAVASADDSYAQREFNDADFDQINEAIAELEGERSNVGATIAAAGIGAAAAASARPARKEFVLDENDEFAAGLDVPHAPKPVARQTSMRSYLMAAGLGTLALIGGIAAYAWTRGPDVPGTTAAPVVLKADVEPVKVAPENPGGKVVPNQDIAVYDKVAGAEQPAGEPQKVLVSKTEDPVDLAAKATARVVLPGPSATDPAQADPAQDVAKAEDRAPATAAEDVSPAQTEIASVAAKKVRTMVVKSDGSLVERPAEVKPVEAATAPDEELLKSMADAAVPATKVQTKPVVAQEEVGAVAKTADPAAETVVASAAVEPEAAAVAATPEAAAVAEPEAPAKPVVKTVKTKKIVQKKVAQEQPQEVAAATNIPLVDARPADQPVNIVAKTGKTPAAGALAEAAAAVVAEPAAPAAPAASGGSYVVQIASAPSPDQAQSTYASLNRKFGKIIGGRDMNIQKADIPGKGTFYRVRIAAGSKKEAAALCAKYKSAGGQCLVAR
jgi:SPOR domain